MSELCCFSFSAKYPQIKKLFGTDPNLKWTVLAMVTTQLIMCYFIKDASWPVLVVTAYCFGGVINHSMTLAIHEISHSLAFGYTKPFANKALAIFGNLIIGVPTAVTFKRYHLDHHRYQGRRSNITFLRQVTHDSLWLLYGFSQGSVLCLNNYQTDAFVCFQLVLNFVVLIFGYQQVKLKFLISPLGLYPKDI